MFDTNGLSLNAWREYGYEVHADRMLYDLDAKRIDAFVARHRHHAAFVVAVPPCTELSSAGARWWKRKRLENPRFQNEAVEGLQRLYRALEELQCPFVILTPAGSRVRAAFAVLGAESFLFDPCQFGGHLDTPVLMEHPKFPDVVPALDAYKKRTLAVTGGGFRRPRRKPVPPKFVEMTVQRNGKPKTLKVCPLLASRSNRNARQLAPRGFCVAAALSNLCR